MTYSNNIREEELKNKVATDFFSSYDTTQILGDVDFCVAVPSEGNSMDSQYFLWAEAKKGYNSVLEESMAQLILTIGKARTFETHLPPSFVGAFDASKIGFVPYNTIHEVFYLNDFNWNVTPSDHTTKEFQTVLKFVQKSLAQNMLYFEFAKDKKELVKFIKANFKVGKKRITRIKISKNNFVVIYQKWLKVVKPTIDVDWDAAKKEGVLDSDFYLADLLSKDNDSILEKLQVLLKKSHYVLGRKKNGLGLFTSSQAEFNDNQNAHKQFWNKYDRPPKKEYWDYIIDRKDLLVPQDIRERQGSYFTPQKWVELSQEYLAAELGEDWQDEYYIWDCAAGTGNLLNGLSNKYHIWASTLNQADVDVMKARIENGANLLPDHVFQFDFLNDSFDKLPQRLREIINNDELRKKLVIYINPPYAEAGNSKQRTGTGANKSGVSFQNKTYEKYKPIIGSACREIFAQFLIRIYHEIPSSVLANFSKLKNLQAPNFRDFRSSFRAKLGRFFLVPANTFDNVKGDFPIGFFIWRTDIHEIFTEKIGDIYDSNGNFLYKTCKSSYLNNENVIVWLRKKYSKEKPIAFLRMNGTNVQNNNGIYLTSRLSQNDLNNKFYTFVTKGNLQYMCIYLAIRQAIPCTWLNDRDQYLSPIEKEVDNDADFQNDCLAFTIFHGQNRISASDDTNHWIPFTEEEVGARDCFKSHFMTDYISGKARPKKEANLFTAQEEENRHLQFSEEARAVFDAGRELWRYYHAQEDSNADASLYDIKMYFQGTKTLKNGKIQMKSDSEDEKYMSLIKALRDKLKILAAKIEPKVYEYGFLLK